MPSYMGLGNNGPGEKLMGKERKLGVPKRIMEVGRNSEDKLVP